jgi:hypothetical protein
LRPNRRCSASRGWCPLLSLPQGEHLALSWLQAVSVTMPIRLTCDRFLPIRLRLSCRFAIMLNHCNTTFAERTKEMRIRAGIISCSPNCGASGPFKC